MEDEGGDSTEIQYKAQKTLHKASQTVWTCLKKRPETVMNRSKGRWTRRLIMQPVSSCHLEKHRDPTISLLFFFGQDFLLAKNSDVDCPLSRSFWLCITYLNRISFLKKNVISRDWPPGRSDAAALFLLWTKQIIATVIVCQKIEVCRAVQTVNYKEGGKCVGREAGCSFFFEKHAGELVSNTTPLTPVTEGSISFLKNKIK